MKYDENGLTVKGYYTEGNLPTVENKSSEKSKIFYWRSNYFYDCCSYQHVCNAELIKVI